MKVTLLTFTILLSVFTLYAQNENKNFTKGKELFNEGNQELSKEKIKAAISRFELALKKEKKNHEILYYLGYAYSRLNEISLEALPDRSSDFTEKASKYFEEIISSGQKYTGDEPFSDPHSKILIEWGSLALKYDYEGQVDSMNWAINEGFRRGAFSPFLLAANQMILNSIPENAILLVGGENYFFPMFYLQKVKEFRKDIRIISPNYLDTQWYPKYLTENQRILWGMDFSQVDQIEYLEWEPKSVTMKSREWVLKPTYLGKYLRRRDLLLFQVLSHYSDTNPIFLTNAFNPDDFLFMVDFVKQNVATKELRFDGKTSFDEVSFMKDIEILMNLSKFLNHSNTGEMNLFDVFRVQIIYQIYLNRQSPDNERSAIDMKELMLKMQVGPELKFQNEDGQKFATKVLHDEE